MLEAKLVLSQVWGVVARLGGSLALPKTPYFSVSNSRTLSII
jgi:hypothetical protein